MKQRPRTAGPEEQEDKRRERGRPGQHRQFLVCPSEVSHRCHGNQAEAHSEEKGKPLLGIEEVDVGEKDKARKQEKVAVLVDEDVLGEGQVQVRSEDVPLVGKDRRCSQVPHGPEHVNELPGCRHQQGYRQYLLKTAIVPG